ncbi:MAG: class I SAM-dependent methyltransferase [Paracoccaceae bacterium]
MDPVAAQYEAYPYPARDPAEETHRLIEGSPSHPVEIDHYLFGGKRDWSQPFRALVAGGGTGDATVMLAQKLADIRAPAEIVHLDTSRAARAVAEARVAARGLSSVRFVTADLLTAPEYGPFDYVDCCGVLHHLLDPDAGFRALAACLKPDGGLGLMVYAPHGRTGVYALQDAFGTLLADDPPEAKVALARKAVDALPATNWLQRNPFVGDHRHSDAGLYDLLLHARDRPYGIEDLVAALRRAGLAPVSTLEPIRYDPLQYLPADPEIVARVRRLSPVQRMGLAERLAGNVKLHVVYAVPAARREAVTPALATPCRDDEASVARLRADPQAIATQVASHGRLAAKLDGLTLGLSFGPAPLAKARAGVIARLDGRPLGEVFAAVPQADAAADWPRLRTLLEAFNLVHMSRGAER